MFSRTSQVARHLPTASYRISSQRPVTIARMFIAEGQRTIRTAACLVIGDEVLGGKTVDVSKPRPCKSEQLALQEGHKLTFADKLSICGEMNLKRIEVIEDDESEIMEAVRRMSDRYDFVVTSGGIGPTHDDITYQSIAKAFGLSIVLHKEAHEKMKRLSKPHPNQPNFDWNTDSPALRAKLRMVELPTDESRDLSEQCIFPQEEFWIPVSIVNRNIYILPGVPPLFQKLLDGLKPHLLPKLADPEGKGTFRVLISTPLPENAVAEYLTKLAAQVGPHGVKVGSYPRWGKKRNTVTLVGRDQAFLEGIVAEVEEGVQGKRVATEGELDEPDAENTARVG